MPRKNSAVLEHSTCAEGAIQLGLDLPPSAPVKDDAARPAMVVRKKISATFEHVPIVVHSHLRWDFVWQRPQQILSRLAANHPIAFVEEPLIDDHAPLHVQVTEVDAGVIRVVPVIPADIRHREFDEQYRMLRPYIDEEFKHHPLLVDRFHNALQWFYSPMTAPHIVDRNNLAGVVYDCMDELANFRFAASDLRERELRLMAKADVIFTGGYELFKSKSRHHRNVHFHGCGVDVAHFAKARQPETKVPEEVADLPRPLLGYFGVIDERIDYELLRQLATALPDASVVVIGPVVKVDPAELPRLPNIHWLGQRPYVDLPGFVKSFDVCLMPFALNAATQYINPTKTLEYMAAGKPIVSTAVADVVRNFTPVVQVARSNVEFIAAAVRCASQPDAALIAQGIAQANDASWDSTVSIMRDEMIAALARV